MRLKRESVGLLIAFGECDVRLKREPRFSFWRMWCEAQESVGLLVAFGEWRA